jgi:hypothetical protein
MSEPPVAELELSPEEQAVADAARTMFAAMAACEQAGGDGNRAFLAAIPPEALAEAKRQFPFLAFLGL